MILKFNCLSLLFCISLLCSCAIEDSVTFEYKEIEQTFKIELDKTTADAETDISSVSAFLFNKGILYKMHPNLPLNQDKQVVISSIPGAQLYFISGVAFLDDLEEGKTPINAFLLKGTASLTSDQKEDPQLFFSQNITISDVNGHSTIQLKRSIARVDLDMTQDPLTQITRITIEGLADQTTYFESNNSRSTFSTMTLDKSYSPAISGVQENLFQIYETGPVKITAYGTYDNVPIQVKVELAKVSRNKIYLVKILNMGGTVTGTFDTLPWETGDTVDGSPGVMDKITIYEPKSVIPSDVVVDYSKNKVDVSEAGGAMTLAFLSDSQVELYHTDGQTSDVSVVAAGVEETSNGVISKFTVSVRPQGKGRLPYVVTLNLKSSLQVAVYDFVQMQVDGSRFPIYEVPLGGVTWMAFNATNCNLEDQIYPLDGQTVAEAYDKNWLSTVGGLFQYGRIYQHIPWQGYGNNTGEQSSNAPWVSASHVPCPDGYKVPTQAEMRALLPIGQTLPGEYTYNGEPVVATLHTASVGFTTPSGVGGTPRYLKITSERTGNALYLPLGGHKGDKSGTNNPNFGHGFSIWCNDNRETPGGWAWIGRFWPGNSNSYTIPTNQEHQLRLEAEGFAYVRCMKK